MADATNQRARRSRRAPVLPYIHLPSQDQKEYHEVTSHVAPTREETLLGSLNGWYDTGGYVFDRHPTRLAHQDWRAFRDPDRHTFRSYNNFLAEHASMVTTGTETLLAGGFLDLLDPAWHDMLRYLAAWRFHESGACKVWQLVEYAAGSESISCCAIQECGARLLAVHALNRYALDLAQAIPGWDDATAMSLWVDDPVLAGARGLVEQALTVKDWAEGIILDAVVAGPLYYEPVLRFFAINAAVHGDVATPTLVSALADLSERRGRWAHAFLQVAASVEANRPVITDWLTVWSDRAVAALSAFAPMYEAVPKAVLKFDAEAARAQARYRRALVDAGLELPVATAS